MRSPRVVKGPCALLLALVCAFALLLPNSSRAQEPSAAAEAANEAFEARLGERLATLTPEVREQWAAASAAREVGDPARAEALYTEILELHPDFEHALRRRCSARMAQDRWADAIADCQAAYDIDRSAENKVTLSMVLAFAPGELGNPTRASALANEVMKQSNNDFTTLSLVCEVALAREDAKLLGRCASKLRGIDARAWESQFYSALAHAYEGDIDKAQAALDRAREAGLDLEIYEEVSAMFERAESPLVYYGIRVGWAVLLWLSAAAALIAAGFALSRLTLAEAEGSLHNPAASARASDSWLRKAYATVLWLSCAYYYLSVPLVLLSVVALGAAIILGLLYIGYLPIKLIAVVVIVVFASVGAVLKSFFTRGRDEPPGIELDLKEAPGLRTILDEVAAKVGTRSVDRVYLEAGADVAVFERGGMLEKLRAKGERCLLLGVAVLDGLDTRAFKAILAHEYGHFSNEDTAGGNFALGVRRSMVHSALGLAQAGAAGWYNPAWVFLNGFHRVFLRISQGASRLQEILADRWAARCYGVSAFERGLRHAIAADLRFDAHAQATIREVVEHRRALRNLYSHAPAATDDEPRDIDAAVEEAVNAEPSPYDSHPRPADRFRWARAIASESAAKEELGPSVWSVFLDRAAIEERLTDVVRMRVAAQIGVVIPADESDSSDEWDSDDSSDEWADDA